jgi:hypothetical protein
MACVLLPLPLSRSTPCVYGRLSRVQTVIMSPSRCICCHAGGFVPLPTILNGKTVDPQLDSSPAVLQLEVRRSVVVVILAVLRVGSSIGVCS